METTQKFLNETIADAAENDINIVTRWTKIDPTRWAAGVFAGILAGAISLVVAMLLCKIGGLELTFPAKLLSTWILGPSANEYGMNVTPIVIGFMIYGAIAAFWGVVYAHFTATNSLSSLLPMGLAWAAFLWVFNWCLFGQSIKPIFVAAIPAGAVFPICLAYGVSLCSVAFFDRTLRG
jgi:hypothetical protein